MNWVRLSSWVLCAMALAFLAVTYAPHQVQSPAKPGDSRSNATTQSTTPEEWERIGHWLSENKCDQRYDFVKKLPEGQVKQKAMGLLASRVRQIDQIKDPKRKEAVIAELRAQDQIFGVQIRYRVNKSSAEAAEAMRKAVANLIDAQIAEKQVQLDRIRDEMKELEKRKEHLDGIAQSYLNQMQMRRHLLHPQGQLNSGTEEESHQADVKH